MDVCSVIKSRLRTLGYEQKDLAAAAEVTESYISQLLTRKKLPPAPERTDIYEKIGRFLQLSRGELATLARAQRMAALRRDYEAPHGALLKEARELVLHKCDPDRREPVRDIFEQQPFGELERLVMQTLMDVIRRVARSKLDDDAWLHELANLTDKSHEQMRVIVLEFLDTDLLNLSSADCVSFIEPLLARWDIDLASFEIDVALNDRLVPGPPKRFAFVEQDADERKRKEPGLAEFLADDALSGDITPEEVACLRRLRFGGKRPRALFYYRALQALRDPLHFEPA